MTPQEKLRQIVANAKGDDLERAELAFKGMTDEQLDSEYGRSGETCRKILDGYRRERALYHEAAALVGITSKR